MFFKMSRVFRKIEKEFICREKKMEESDALPRMGTVPLALEDERKLAMFTDMVDMMEKNRDLCEAERIFDTINYGYDYSITLDEMSWNRWDICLAFNGFNIIDLRQFSDFQDYVNGYNRRFDTLWDYLMEKKRKERMAEEDDFMRRMKEKYQ